MGAYLNVKINAKSLHDKAFAADLVARGAEIERQAQAAETEILRIVNGRP
jgi:glutamate formiminotransferase/formiminotetrahydrofolate cyclodeaminase